MEMLKVIIPIVTSLWSFLLSDSVSAISDGFNISQMPQGHTITLPHPAITLVPLNLNVQLTSTDLPQTIKISNAMGQITDRGGKDSRK